jgi:hypothetical protein
MTEIPELTVHVVPGWNSNIRAARQERQWMTNTPHQYSYRCLPLNIANSSGWEVLNPFTFDVFWTGGQGKENLFINAPPNTPKQITPESLFGSGIITFHVFGLFRTSPGWNLWVGGSPNYFKDGVQALTGIVETDWSVYSFTMNWAMTRPGAVRFEKDEPICFFFPIQRNVVNNIQPKIKYLSEDPDFDRQFNKWSDVTNAFHEKMRTDPPKDNKDSWQRRYFQGKDMDGKYHDGHQSKLRVKEFEDTTKSPVSDRQLELKSNETATLASNQSKVEE